MSHQCFCNARGFLSNRPPGFCKQWKTWMCHRYFLYRMPTCIQVTIIFCIHCQKMDVSSIWSSLHGGLPLFEILVLHTVQKTQMLTSNFLHSKGVGLHSLSTVCWQDAHYFLCCIHLSHPLFSTLRVLPSSKKRIFLCYGGKHCTIYIIRLGSSVFIDTLLFSALG